MAHFDPDYKKAVPRFATRRPWIAQVTQYGRNIKLGHFHTREEAEARECLEWERYYWGG